MNPELRKLREQQLALQSTLFNRAAADPLKTFEPFLIQKKFISSVVEGSVTENYYIGANRSGKSDAGAYAGAHLARYGNQSSGLPWSRGKPFKGKNDKSPGPPVRVELRDRATSGWVSALDFPTGRDTIQPKYFDNGFLPPGSTHEPFIPKHEIADWRAGDQILKLKNGSIIGFKSSDSGRLKYQGAEKDWVHLDEEHPEDIYEEIFIRRSARKLRIFTTCTLLPPEGVVGGITWLFNKIVKPWQAGTLEGVEIFNASIYDNPHIPEAEIRKLESKFPDGSVGRRIRLNGELIGGLSGSRVYSGFDHRLHVRPQGEIMLRRPLAWIWDFNVEPMVSLIGQRDHGLFRFFRELILEEGNIQEMCELFRSHHPNHLAEIYVYGDSSGKDRSHQTKMTSYQVILNNMKDYPVPIKLRVPEKNPSVTSRIDAMNVAFKDEEGRINMEIDPQCEELISDFEQVISDGKGGIKKTHNRKDPYFKRTHTSDAGGYWVAYEAPVKPTQEVRNEGRGPVNIPRPGY